jgi:hypothetical protein
MLSLLALRISALKLKLSGISKFGENLAGACHDKNGDTNQQKVEKQTDLRFGWRKKICWALSPPESRRAPRRMNLRESLETIFARFAVHMD